MSSYNNEAETAESEMLLFNIGELSAHLPPHFMMLQEIDQTRTFSGAGSFSWTYLTDSLFHLFGTTPATSVATNGSDTYLAGFTGTAIESPTIKFLPLQGPDFFQRLESPQTDKFMFFLEEQNHYGTWEQREWLTLLFAESLKLDSGSGSCQRGNYLNGYSGSPEFQYHYEELDACVKQITNRDGLELKSIDGAAHQIADFRWGTGTPPGPRGTPAGTSPVDEPKAADVLAAIQAGYLWRPDNKTTSCIASNGPPCYTFSNYIKTGGWFDPSSIYDGLSQDRKDAIVGSLWPNPADYFYIDVTDTGVTNTLLYKKATDTSPRITGSFKVANLLEIMKRLGEMACDEDDPDLRKADNCVFGYSKSVIFPVPRWADQSTTFVSRNNYLGARDIESVWVPAHDPNSRDPNQRKLAERDRYVFLELSKLYQTSLVDTSKLVTGSTPITISK
jgi:hypothetical protein